MKQALFIFLTLLGLGNPLESASVSDISTKEILHRVWQNLNLQSFTLSSVMRHEQKFHPFQLQTRGREMIYKFTESPLQVKVEVSPKGSQVWKRQNAQQKWLLLSKNERTQFILNSDICYEDLTLDFLNWPQITLLGDDSLKTLSAYVLEAHNPLAEDKVSHIRFWISQEHFVLLRFDVYGGDDKPFKRVEVNGVQQIDQAWVVKELQVSTLRPGTILSKSRTYLEIHNEITK